MRKHVLLCTTAALMACGGDWMTGPGVPVELSHESLEGRWVHTHTLITRVGNPAVQHRAEISPDKGSILEFDGAGGVQRSRYVEGGFFPQEYTISADTLTVWFSYQAEVSTSRLILTLRGITFDFNEDGTGEDAVEVLTYQKGKD
jgi:hypothetical protein